MFHVVSHIQYPDCFILQEATRTHYSLTGRSPMATPSSCCAPLHMAPRTFLRTGGVTRSRPAEPALRRDDLVGMGETTGEIRLLRIEAYDGTDWQRVAVQ